MGVQLPTSIRELLPGPVTHAVRRSTRAHAWWVVVIVLVTAAALPVLLRAPPESALGALPWILAPLVALIAWLDVSVRASARVRTSFWLFTAAAAIGLAAHLLWVYEHEVLGRPGVPLGMYLFLALHPVMAAGIGLTLGSWRDVAWNRSLTADALLVVVAGVIAVLRYVVEPVLVATGPDDPAIVTIAVLQAVSLAPLFLAVLLVLRRRAAVSPWSAIGLLGATFAFAAGSMLAFSGLHTEPLSVGDPLDTLWLAGWIGFAFAAMTARTVPSTARAMLARRRTPDSLRRLVMPGAALFLAIVAVDMALRPTGRTEGVVALAAMGALLAFRTAFGTGMADRDADQRRQLAHTRALVAATHALAGTTDLDTTLRIICENARAVFRTRAAGIELITDDGAMLEARAAVGLPASVMGLRYDVGGSFTGWVVQHGQARATVDPKEDPYIQPESLAFLGRSPVAAAPLRFRGKTTGALYACIRSEPFDAAELDLLGALAEQAAIAIENARLFEQVKVLSVTDPLTGLANRRQLEREIRREFAAARRGRELVAVMFDLDEFKEYNDMYGHLAGDEALKTFANALREETRAMNLAARYGGDEFVVLLSDADRAGAEGFLQRVRDRFRYGSAALGRREIHVSAGMARYRPEMEGPEALLREADDRLYAEKPRSRR